MPGHRSQYSRYSSDHPLTRLTDTTSPHTLGRRRRAKKHTVVCDMLGFLGVVGACTCNRYQAKGPVNNAMI